MKGRQVLGAQLTMGFEFFEKVEFFNHSTPTTCYVETKAEKYHVPADPQVPQNGDKFRAVSLGHQDQPEGDSSGEPDEKSQPGYPGRKFVGHLEIAFLHVFQI